MSESQATPEAVWPYVVAGCNASEIAAWFGISIAGAEWLAWSAEMAHRREMGLAA